MLETQLEKLAHLASVELTYKNLDKKKHGDTITFVGGGSARSKGRLTNKNKRRSRKYKRTVSHRKKRTPTIKRRRRKTKKNIRTRRAH